MSKAKKVEADRTPELLEKLITLQLYSMGASQNAIASFLSKSKSWVNAQLKGFPKRRTDG